MKEYLKEQGQGQKAGQYEEKKPGQGMPGQGTPGKQHQTDTGGKGGQTGGTTSGSKT